MLSAANKENNSLKDLLEKLRNECDQIKSENNKLKIDNSKICKNLNQKQSELDKMIDKNAQNQQNNNNNCSDQIKMKENEIKKHLEAIQDLETRLNTLNDLYNNFKIQSEY